MKTAVLDTFLPSHYTNISETFLHQNYTKVKMSYSVKVKLRSDRARKDGTCMIYVQVLINSKIWRHNLEITWPEKFFNDTAYCKNRYKDDPDAKDYNLIIKDALGRINEIFKHYRITNQILTIDIFDKEFNNPLSKIDFIQYYEAKMNERLRNGDVEKMTWKNNNNTLNKLKKFSKGILFCHLAHKFSLEFDRFLKNECNLKMPNGRWGHHKDIKTFLSLAKKDKITFEDPYEGFKNTSTPGKWKPASKETLNTLYKHYKEHTIVGTSERRVLQSFLGGCLIGLRISDQKRIKKNQLISGNLVFVPYKTRKKNKILVLPLLPKAIEIIKDSMQENDCDTIFYNYADQFANRKLKEIAKKLDIKDKLHHHVGRETFGTLYIASGGSVTTLQKYYDHFNISTTMKYVHEDDERIKQDVIKMVNLID